jgi:hypothetical protein
MGVKLQVLASIVMVAMIINVYSVYGIANRRLSPGPSQLKGNGTQLEKINPEDLQIAGNESHLAPLRGPSLLEHNSTQFLSPVPPL